MLSNDGFDIDADRFLLLEPTLEETGGSTSTAAMFNRDWYVALYVPRVYLGGLDTQEWNNTVLHKGNSYTRMGGWWSGKKNKQC